jgi:ribose 5-phosphate isomerase B
MRLAVSADHAGYELKDRLASELRALGHDVLDLGTNGPAAVDYPDFAASAARAVVEGRVDRAVVVCGSGVGASIAANKIRGARAGLCHDCYSARQGVQHDDMNILVLGSRVVGPALASDLLRSFLAGTFTGEERHVRRLAKVAALEAGS